MKSVKNDNDNDVALQHFAGDFDHTALSSLQFFERKSVCRCPQFRKQGQTTTVGTSCATLWEKCAGSLTSPANQYREDAGDGAYGL